MWKWITLVVMILSTMIAGAIIAPMEDKAEDPARKKRLEKIGIGFALVGCVCLLVFLFYGIGWLWYFLGGFLVVHCSDDFWEYVFNGLISLIPLFGIIGLILIAMGWDPDKK